MKPNPGIAHRTAATTGAIRDGLPGQIRQGKFELFSDLGRDLGGEVIGPSPSRHARAAVASCVAIAIKIHAAD